jgi:hypothetical protein
MLKKFKIFPDNKIFKHQIIFIDGTFRSGKTSIAQLISSTKNIDFIDEPVVLNLLPIYVKKKLVPKKKGSELFKLYLEELFYDIVVCRRSNFRKIDDSTIHKNTSLNEINLRKKIKNRVEAEKYAKNKKFKLIISIPDNLSNHEFIKKNLENYKFINIFRGGISVADDLSKKGIFKSKNFFKPFDSMLTFKIKINKNVYYLPWWVKKNEIKLFLKLNTFSKCLYYWCEIWSKYKKVTSNNDFLINFDDYVDNKKKFQKEIFKKLNLKKTKFTSEVLKSFRYKEKNEDEIVKKNKIPIWLINRYNKINIKFK